LSPGRGTPAKSSETATPKSSRKSILKKEETPQKVASTPLKLKIVATPRSSRRQSVAVCQSTKEVSPGTPSRSSRRLSQVPKRFRDDSSGDEFERKSSCSKSKRAKTEIEPEKKSSKVEHSNKSTPTRQPAIARCQCYNFFSVVIDWA
jgi:hypothetical protein